MPAVFGEHAAVTLSVHGDNQSGGQKFSFCDFENVDAENRNCRHYQWTNRSSNVNSLGRIKFEAGFVDDGAGMEVGPPGR